MHRRKKRIDHEVEDQNNSHQAVLTVKKILQKSDNNKD